MAESIPKPMAEATLERPDIHVQRINEKGSTIKLYDVHFVIAKGTFHVTISARKFAAQICDGPAIAEVSTYCDIDDIPMCKIEVLLAPRKRSDRPLSVIRFRKDMMVISRTVYSKPASFAILAEDTSTLPDQVFGSFP